jgi:hypothetical protein
LALRFNKRIKIAPGVRLNLSKTGISTTVGPRGASLNVSKKGVYANAGIPGTGLSTRTKLAAGKPVQKSPSNLEPPEMQKGGNLFAALGVIAIIGLFVWLIAS